MQANPNDMSAIAAQTVVMAEEMKRCERWPSHRPSADAIKAADEVLTMASTYGSPSAKRAVAVLGIELDRKPGDGGHCTDCGKFIPSGENWDCHADDCSWAAS